MKRQFTTSVYILDEDKVLLIFHPKFQKWLPPGGHIEENELPSEAAKREVLEETGLEISFYSDENIWVHSSNAKSVERPYLCQLQDVPAYKNEEAHQHMDQIFVARPLLDKPPSNPPELLMKWFTLSELKSIEHLVFTESIEIIEHLLTTFSHKETISPL